MIHILQTKAYKRMFHLIENKKSVKIPHRLPIEHAPAPPSQCQVNAESCKTYSTIFFEKDDNKVPEHREKTVVLTLFRKRTPDCNSIRIELGSGRYFVKVTSSALMLKLQL